MKRRNQSCLHALFGLNWTIALNHNDIYIYSPCVQVCSIFLRSINFYLSKRTTISVLSCGISLSPPMKTQSTQVTAPHYTCQYKSTPFSLFPYSSSLTEIPKFKSSVMAAPSTEIPKLCISPIRLKLQLHPLVFHFILSFYTFQQEDFQCLCV